MPRTKFDVEVEKRNPEITPYEREALALALETLQVLALNTPMVDSDYPILGKRADDFDAMREKLRAWILKVAPFIYEGDLISWPAMIDQQEQI